MKGNLMRAMVLTKAGSRLELLELPTPEAGRKQLLLEVVACGICRTDLHIVDGELTEPSLPLVPGHQIVGVVRGIGESVTGFQIGQRVGVPWLGGCCGECLYCRDERENLCDDPTFTGYQVNGGFAESTVAQSDFCFPIPEGYDSIQAAPLLCAGLIGYRALRMVGDAERVGFYGFGSAAHILTQVAVWQGRQVFAFTRRGDQSSQAFALELGAQWAGDSERTPPAPLDAAIIFAPVGSLVVDALTHVRKGGTVVCAGIHMSDIPSFPYELLWGERIVRSVANLTRADGIEFLSLAPQIPIKTHVIEYGLTEANEALEALRQGLFEGAAVIRI